MVFALCTEQLGEIFALLRLMEWGDSARWHGLRVQMWVRGRAHGSWIQTDALFWQSRRRGSTTLTEGQPMNSVKMSDRRTLVGHGGKCAWMAGQVSCSLYTLATGHRTWDNNQGLGMHILYNKCRLSEVGGAT
jgi:hypothetical protein